MSAFFALLSLVTLFGGVAILVVLAAGHATATRGLVERHALGAAAAVTGTATLGSLYYSEIAGFPPCALCWYQRIFAYPLAVILTAALVRHVWRSRGAGLPPPTGVWAHALPLAAIGLPLSIWHVFVQRTPTLEGTSCEAANPCSLIWVEQFGFVTIPFMAGTAFLFVLAAGTAAVAGDRRRDRLDDDTSPPRGPQHADKVER